MPRGYRLALCAAFGWLILIASPQPSGATANPRADNTQKEISNSLGRIADPFNEANKPKREAADCPEGADDRKSDLCAQWKAADAAESSAVAANTSVTIGWWGIGLGTITMGAAIAAAGFAKLAADHTKRSADAAHEANRPYILISCDRVATTCSRWRQGADMFKWEFALTNHGNSPAIIKSVKAAVAINDVIPLDNSGRFSVKSEFSGYSEGFVESRADEVMEPKVSIKETRPGHRLIHLQEGALPLSGENQKMVLARLVGMPFGDRQLPLIYWWLVGVIRYEDVFGRSFETNFCLRMITIGERISVEGGKKYNKRT